MVHQSLRCRALAAALAVAGLLGACGSDDSDSDAAVASSTSAGGESTTAPSGPITVGLMHLNKAEADAVTGAIGTGLETPDARRMFEVVVDDVNAAGGVAGRQLEPVFHEVSINDSVGQVAASTCAAFTQDQHVFAVLATRDNPDLDRCLQDAGVVEVSIQAFHTTADYADLPNLVEPPALSLERFGAAYGEQLADAGFFDDPAPAKVAVLYQDSARWRTALDALVAGLEDRGIEVADQIALPNPQSQDEQTELLTAAQSAVLRLKSDGVTHVLFLEEDAYAAAGVVLGAQSQGYQPRLGFNSFESLTNIQANLPAAALAGTMFAGWWPGSDTTDDADLPPAGRACLELMRTNGVEVESGNQRKRALEICEAVYFFKAAVEAGGATPGAIVGGLADAAASYDPVMTFGINLDDGRRDGVAAMRVGTYDGTCSCFTYSGEPVPIP